MEQRVNRSGETNSEDWKSVTNMCRNPGSISSTGRRMERREEGRENKKCRPWRPKPAGLALGAEA